MTEWFPHSSSNELVSIPQIYPNRKMANAPDRSFLWFPFAGPQLIVLPAPNPSRATHITLSLHHLMAAALQPSFVLLLQTVFPFGVAGPLLLSVSPRMNLLAQPVRPPCLQPKNSGTRLHWTWPGPSLNLARLALGSKPNLGLPPRPNRTFTEPNCLLSAK